MPLIPHLRTTRRLVSVLAPNIAPGLILLPLMLGWSHAAVLVALVAIAWLAILKASVATGTARLRAAEQRIADLETELANANTDPVTGLPIRRIAERHLVSAGDEQVTVAVVDVDDMHGLNNRNDHQFGDAYLATIAQRLQDLAADGDLVARLGGDEFVLITRRPPTVLARAVTIAIGEPAVIRGIRVPIQLSVGICRVTGGDPHRAFGCADLAMFTAKRRRSTIEHYDPARDGIPQPAGARPAMRPRDRGDVPGARRSHQPPREAR
jgi:diguanylate cyclase (GGDEF)-like protein